MYVYSNEGSLSCNMSSVCPHLHHAVFWYAGDGFQVAADLLQTVGHILIKQNSEVRPL